MDKKQTIALFHRYWHKNTDSYPVFLLKHIMRASSSDDMELRCAAIELVCKGLMGMQSAFMKKYNITPLFADYEDCIQGCSLEVVKRLSKWSISEGKLSTYFHPFYEAVYRNAARGAAGLGTHYQNRVKTDARKGIKYLKEKTDKTHFSNKEIAEAVKKVTGREYSSRQIRNALERDITVGYYDEITPHNGEDDSDASEPEIADSSFTPEEIYVANDEKWMYKDVLGSLPHLYQEIIRVELCLIENRGIRSPKIGIPDKEIQARCKAPAISRLPEKNFKELRRRAEMAWGFAIKRGAEISTTPYISIEVPSNRPVQETVLRFA